MRRGISRREAQKLTNLRVCHIDQWKLNAIIKFVTQIEQKWPHDKEGGIRINEPSWRFFLAALYDTLNCKIHSQNKDVCEKYFKIKKTYNKTKLIN